MTLDYVTNLLLNMQAGLLPEQLNQNEVRALQQHSVIIGLKT